MTVWPHGVHVASELGAYVLAPDVGTAPKVRHPCPSSTRTTCTSGHVGTASDLNIRAAPRRCG
jgi:hypothetical protein